MIGFEESYCRKWLNLMPQVTFILLPQVIESYCRKWWVSRVFCIRWIYVFGCKFMCHVCVVMLSLACASCLQCSGPGNLHGRRQTTWKNPLPWSPVSDRRPSISLWPEPCPCLPRLPSLRECRLEIEEATGCDWFDLISTANCHAMGTVPANFPCSRSQLKPSEQRSKMPWTSLSGS